MKRLDRFINNLRKRLRTREIKVLRLPPRKVLRTMQLGLTLGFLFSTTVLFVDPTPSSQITLPIKIIIVLFLLWMTFLRGSGLTILLIIWALASVYHRDQTSLLLQHYFIGFLLGVLFAQVYNGCVYVLLRWVFKFYKIAFIYDTRKTFNIIKSPIVDELPQSLKDKKDDYLYNYNVAPIPKCPYTIVFVANPRVYISSEAKSDPDPIMDDLELFISSIHKAMMSFENDEVLGCREIWSRVRIVSIFDPEFNVLLDKDDALVQSYPYTLIINGKVQDNNIITPRETMWATIKKYGKDVIAHSAVSRNEKNKLQMEFQAVCNQVDVVFAMSASPKYTRSSALFSESEKYDPANPPEGVTAFEYDTLRDVQPEADQQGDQHVKHKIICIHEEFADVPGRVALNVLESSLKTYIHEFAHAMSSTVNGAIVDEYFDRINVLDDAQGIEESEDLKKNPFLINRMEREEHDDNWEEIPRKFASYNGDFYLSDLDHPSAEEDWFGYFPQRKCCTDGCTMDRTYGSYRFDDLLSQFMYDRLLVKINRTL